MSLHGTLDSFPLADVLRFLSGAQRTGVLQVDGDRGSIRLWMEDGECTGAERGGAVLEDAVPATLEALRYVSGTFTFTEGGTTTRRLHPRPLGVILGEALDLRAEWDSIELVLPTTRHRVRPVHTPPDGRVVLDPLGWRLVTSLGRSDDVGSVVARSGVGELDAARALVGLVRDGLVVVEDPAGPGAASAEVVVAPSPADTVASVVAEPCTLDPAGADPFVGDPVPSVPERFPIDDLLDATTGLGASAASAPPEVATAFSPEAASAVAEVVAADVTAQPPPEVGGPDPAFR